MGVGVGKGGLEVNCCTMGPQTSVTTLVKEKKKRKKIFSFLFVYFLTTYFPFIFPCS